MTTESYSSIRASRYRVPRTRGAMSGVLLILLGAWAALVPMIGPYFNLAYTPAPDDAWHWTAARGWFEVAPGAAAFLGGLLLLVSASRVTTSLGGWLAAAGGAWLVIGPALDGLLTIDLGTPDPSSSTRMQAVESLLLFYAIGAAILLVAGVALGRLSVRTLRDVQAAEQRLAAEEAEMESPTAYLREPEDAQGRHGAPAMQEVPPEGAMAPAGGQKGYPSSYSEPTYTPTGQPPQE
jgi:hypothetical protein